MFLIHRLKHAQHLAPGKALTGAQPSRFYPPLVVLLKHKALIGQPQ